MITCFKIKRTVRKLLPASMAGTTGKAAKTDEITSSFQGWIQLFNVDDFYEKNTGAPEQLTSFVRSH